MFKEFRQFAGLLQQLPRIKEEMERFQQKLGQLSAEGDAGGGMVTVRLNGRMEMLACTISDEAMRLGDKEMLEDLIRAATNQAVEKVRALLAEESSKLATGLGVPPGMGLPGLG